MKNLNRGSRLHDILKKFIDFDLTSSYSISALSEQKDIKLMYFVHLDLICINPEELRNRDSTGRESSEILSIVLEIEHFDICTVPYQ